MKGKMRAACCREHGEVEQLPSITGGGHLGTKLGRHRRSAYSAFTPPSAVASRRSGRVGCKGRLDVFLFLSTIFSNLSVAVVGNFVFG
jgi:hypothetical protein